MRWAFLVAMLVGCSSTDDTFIGADASAVDATLDTCPAFTCFDAITFDAPVPVACPVWQPIEGSACNVPDYQDCEYGPYTYLCNLHFRCAAGQWVKIPNFGCGLADACSTIADGGACHAGGQVCASGDAGICVCSACGAGPPLPPAPFADASEPTAGRWSCFALPDGCSQDRPNVGTTCDSPDGSVCPYSPGGCCIGVMEQCASGVWLGFETEPCP